MHKGREKGQIFPGGFEGISQKANGVTLMGQKNKAILPHKAGHLGKMASNNKNHKKYNRLLLVSQLLSTGHKAWRPLSRCGLPGVTITLARTHCLSKIIIIVKGGFYEKIASATHIFNLLLHLLQKQLLSHNCLMLKCLFCSCKPLQIRFIVATLEVMPCFLMT